MHRIAKTRAIMMNQAWRLWFNLDSLWAKYCVNFKSPRTPVMLLIYGKRSICGKELLNEMRWIIGSGN